MLPSEPHPQGVQVRAATVADWAVLRATRLAALRDAPGAFAERYENLAPLEPGAWRELVEGWTRAPHGASVLALHGGDGIGMCGAFHESGLRVRLVAMWVAPHWRGTPVGPRLVAAVSTFARANGATTLAAWVVEDNARALRFYRRVGFVDEGIRQPLAARAGVHECSLALALR